MPLPIEANRCLKNKTSPFPRLSAEIARLLAIGNVSKDWAACDVCSRNCKILFPRAEQKCDRAPLHVDDALLNIRAADAPFPSNEARQSLQSRESFHPDTPEHTRIRSRGGRLDIDRRLGSLGCF